ncbi:pyridoxal phosphate homeostasis protein isoform X1 [Microplitis mediator]|uniref:pyridoxal phosphate homeostasis protein isoform X1 n=2 Tax=Microplitis mediator TaxID=375433 RepID=UPI002552D789|nr:pyridoxal phosphate homeostasis protein isoform X1 [Microplitis mediator]XP_057340847.1 pyridoxal phosphate homeostasis protein isoform X1 [Microplitis mediator]
MKIKMVDIAGNLNFVREKISKACSRRSPEFGNSIPRLVAVSKTKPANLLIDAYDAGQKHFGENYVNELIEKSGHPEILKRDIRWHFIGHLQRNKINKVLAVPNLWIIETVDSNKLASALDTAWTKYRKNDDNKLNIMVQVNTSKEEEKSGCDLSEASSLVKHVIENCKNLKFLGIMTIGAYGYDPSNGPNPDFVSLRQCRDDICKELNLVRDQVELSMGMSTDYEHAIELGSTNVRVGSAIFGERPPKN